MLASEYSWKNGGPKRLTIRVNLPVPNRGGNLMVCAFLRLVHDTRDGVVRVFSLL